MSGDTPDTPEGWRLSPAEIERLANDAVGEPAGGDNSWRPEGGSLIAGVGQCLYDEIRSIWDLIVLLKQFNDDIDLAADGVDNWDIWRSHVGDMATVFALLTSLNAGRQDFGALPYPQQLALFKVYAKITAIKETLANMAKAGLNMVAAYDVIWNTDYEIFTFNQSENVLKALADAISLFYTDEEWLAMAEGGRELADRVTTLIKDRFEQDPWGSSGYVACLVALFFSPTKLLRALRPLIRAFSGIGRSSNVADMARILRAHNVEVPDWLGGRRDGPDLETPTTRRESTPETTPDPDPETPLSREDARPARAENPTDRKTPDPDGNTTNIRGKGQNPRMSQGKRSNVAGETAELQARRELELEHPNAEVIDLKYGANSGVDNLVIYRNADGDITRVINVETKGRVYDAANPDAPFNLSGPQAGGPEAHLARTLQNMDGSPLKRELERFLRSDNPDVTGELRGYRVNPETGEVTGRTRQDWTADQTRYNFDLDTGYNSGQVNPQELLGNVLRRLSSETRENWFNQYPELRDMFDANGNPL